MVMIKWLSGIKAVHQRHKARPETLMAQQSKNNAAPAEEGEQPGWLARLSLASLMYIYL